MKEDLINEESEISYKIIKTINRLYREVVEIKNKSNICRFFLEVKELIISLGFI